MCGIAGMMTADGAAVSQAVLDALGDALAHRGPDGRGRHIAGDVGLVQTRLAIIDLTTGDQPLFAPGGVALVGNGEIYNYRELREEMAGTVFATQSDCEPPLHLYLKMGLDFTDRLRGMYALAIHDSKTGRLILARDPFGIKPLYYAETPQGFAFASEPQALVAAGLVAPRERTESRGELLQLQFTTGAETIFAGIRRMLPGETLVVEKGCIVESRRQDALPLVATDDDPRRRDLDLLLYDLDAVLTESVTLHQRSDVPYGMFLSGGIDSSALLALMARLNARPVEAFTIGFPGTRAADERAHAASLARKLGARHTEISFTEKDFWNLLPEAAAIMDDPAADYAVLPTYMLAREARKQVKVILSGEGGDELFAGYGRYRAAQRPWPFARAMRRRGAFDGLDILREQPHAWRAGIAAAEQNQRATARSRLQRAQAVDCEDWLPNDLLTKLDRCLMAQGIEGRVPFLDLVVARFAFPLPDARKVHKGLGKYILRQWLDRALPEAEAFSKKRGFTVPVGEWIFAQGGRLAPLLARQESMARICRPGAVERLLARGDARHGFAAWSLLFYALWHRRHMEGRPPAGDVFAALAA